MILNVEIGTRSIDYFYEYSYADDEDLSEELVDAKDFVSCMTNAPTVELVFADANVGDLFD